MRSRSARTERPTARSAGTYNSGSPAWPGTGYAFNEAAGSCDPNHQATGDQPGGAPSSSAFAVGTQPFSFGLWLRTTSVPGREAGATRNYDFDLWRQATEWKIELYPNHDQTYGVARCLWHGSLNRATTKAWIYVPRRRRRTSTRAIWTTLLCFDIG